MRSHCCSETRCASRCAYGHVAAEGRSIFCAQAIIQPMTYIGRDERDEIRAIARIDPAAALSTARGVTDRWRRVQSLAVAAWYHPDDKEASAVACEALRLAHELSVPNRVVSVSAWPLRVLVSRDPIAAGDAVRQLLTVIASEANPVRRADALILVLTAVYRNDDARTAVLRALVEACTATRAWKASWVLYRTTLMFASTDTDTAVELASKIQSERRKRQAFRELASKESRDTPELFWWASGELSSRT